MKIKFISIVFGALLTLAVQAENLIFNPSFTQLKNDKVATAWSSVGKTDITFSAKDGSQPDTGYAVFAEGKDNALGSIRQNMKNKVKTGKKYRLTFDCKGENFKASDYGFLLINTSWKGNVGLRRFQLRQDGKWRKMSKVVVIPESWTSVTAVVFAADIKGKFYVSNLKCEPVAE